MEVKFTKFSRTDGDKLLCKKMSLSEEGEIVKTSSANMLTGSFETVKVDFTTGFGELLKGLTLDQALGLGVCQYCAEGKVVTRSSDKENVNSQYLCRTKDNFVWGEKHNLIFFDIDKNTEDLTKIITDLYTTCPELAATHLWAYPSAGSCVAKEGEEIGDEAVSGWHIYALIAGDVTKFQQWLEIKLWNGGMGWIEVSKSGAMLKRCLADLAVFSPERLDFIAGSYCGKGLRQERGEPQFISGDTDDPLTADWSVSPEDYREFLSRVERAKFGKESESSKVKKNYAGELVAAGKAPDIVSAIQLIDSANETGELLGSWQIALDNGELYSVSTILDRPDQFDGLTCSDPLEPDYGGGRCKAKIFWNLKEGNEVRVTSFAHGGRQWLLKYDYASLLNWVNDPGVQPETIISAWKYKMGSKKSVITDEERSDILKKIKARIGGGVSLSSLKSTLQKREIQETLKEIDSEIAELNKHFAVLPIGNKVRILREFETTGLDGQERRDFTIISKQDFALLKQNKMVLVGDKMKPLSDVWLTSKKRKEFKGIEFNPSIIGEYDGLYNPYQGMAVEPEEGDWGLMQAHMLEILCQGNQEWFDWMLSWCANCVQNPGDKRVGTAIVLQGGQGTGKGSFVTWFGKIFGQHYLPISSIRHMVGNFNSHLKDVILLFADEAFWGGNVSEEGVLKQMVSEDMIPIEPKGIDTFAVTNHINLIMATNNEWAVPASMDDRRFFVLKVAGNKAVNEEYFKPLHAQMENGGLGAMMYDLMHHEIKHNLRQAPKTPALFKQKQQKMSPEEDFIFWALDSNDVEIWDNFIAMSTLYEKFNEHVRHSRAVPHQTQTSFNRRLTTLVKTFAAPIRGTLGGKRTYGLRFSDVKKARSEFEKLVGQEIPWMDLETDPDDL